MANLDFKDLRILQALFEARSVSGAAQLVGLSQPSLSIRLARLRRHFQDPLFVRTTAGMQPTPRAEALVPAVEQAMGLFDGVVGAVPAFEPAVSERVFKIAMVNIGQIVVLPKLLAELKSRAPRLRVEVKDLDAAAPRMLEAGDIDLAMGFTFDIQAGFYQQKLFTEYYVCVVAESNDQIGRHISRSQFAQASHVVVATEGTGHWLIDKAIEDAGIERQIALRVPSFLGLAEIVANTDLIAVAPVHLARIMARNGGIRVLKVPITLPSYLVKQYWHERFHRDPGNRWLRGVVVEVFRSG